MYACIRAHSIYMYTHMHRESMCAYVHAYIRTVYMSTRIQRERESVRICVCVCVCVIRTAIVVSLLRWRLRAKGAVLKYFIHLYFEENYHNIHQNSHPLIAQHYLHPINPSDDVFYRWYQDFLACAFLREVTRMARGATWLLFGGLACTVWRDFLRRLLPLEWRGRSYGKQGCLIVFDSMKPWKHFLALNSIWFNQESFCVIWRHPWRARSASYEVTRIPRVK